MAQELKAYNVVASSETQNYLDGETHLAFEAYDADEVDAVLAEKDAEIRRLQRALWLAHAYKAKFKRWWLHLALDCEASTIRPDIKTINRIKGKIENCEKSERKCRAKAEDYK